MYQELKSLIEKLDAVESEIYRQSSLTDDPDLKAWSSTSGREVYDMKNELQTYVEKLEAAGDVLN